MVHSELPAGGAKRRTSPKVSSVKETERKKMLSSLFPQPHFQIQPPTEQPEGLETSHPTIHCTAGPSCGSLQSGLSLIHQGPCQIQKLPLPLLKLRNKQAVKTKPNKGLKNSRIPRWTGCHPMRWPVGHTVWPCLDTGGTSSESLGSSRIPHSITAPLSGQ